MKTISIIFLLLIHLIGRAQNTDGLSILLDDLKTLSADEMEGRRTGTPGGAKARIYILDRFENIELKPFNDSFVQEFVIPKMGKSQPKSGYNLVGYLPGSSDEIIVVSAHYDHLGIKDNEVYNGSDDNASGVSAMLFVASQLSDVELNNTFVFIAFDAEEEGLLGAEAFLSDPPVPLEKIIFNLNLDMVSRSKAGEIFASGTYYYPDLKEELKLWREAYPIKIRFGHDNLADKKNDWTYSSDHGPFHKKGIPFIYFGVEDHDDYHKPTDTYEKADLDFFGEFAQALTDIAMKLDKFDLKSLVK